MALADARLLGEQAGLEQRLADGLGELAVVAREAAREVGELGVVAAPLPHPVEPLEDPPGDAARGVGVVVRADDLARGGRRGVEEGEDGVLVLGERGGVGRAAAEPARRRAATTQRVGDPDRRLEVRDVVEHEGREREGAGAEAVDPRDLAVEGERDELGLGGVARDLEREVVAGRAREHARRFRRPRRARR